MRFSTTNLPTLFPFIIKENTVHVCNIYLHVDMMFQINIGL